MCISVFSHRIKGTLQISEAFSPSWAVPSILVPYCTYFIHLDLHDSHFCLLDLRLLGSFEFLFHTVPAQWPEHCRQAEAEQLQGSPLLFSFSVGIVVLSCLFPNVWKYLVHLFGVISYLKWEGNSGICYSIMTRDLFLLLQLLEVGRDTENWERGQA